MTSKHLALQVYKKSFQPPGTDRVVLPFHLWLHQMIQLYEVTAKYCILYDYIIMYPVHTYVPQGFEPLNCLSSSVYLYHAQIVDLLHYQYP